MIKSQTSKQTRPLRTLLLKLHNKQFSNLKQSVNHLIFLETALLMYFYKFENLLGIFLSSKLLRTNIPEYYVCCSQLALWHHSVMSIFM